MGKGARNRKTRREVEARRDGVMRVIGQLLEVEDWEDFTTLLEAEPEALGPVVLEALAAMGENEGYGASFRLLAELVENARSYPRAAWDEFALRRDEMAARSQEGETIDGPGPTSGLNSGSGGKVVSMPQPPPCPPGRTIIQIIMPIISAQPSGAMNANAPAPAATSTIATATRPAQMAM